MRQWGREFNFTSRKIFGGMSSSQINLLSDLRNCFWKCDMWTSIPLWIHAIKFMAWFRHVMWFNYGYFVDHNFPARVLNLYLAWIYIFSPFVPNHSHSHFYRGRSAGESLRPCGALPWLQSFLQREQIYPLASQCPAVQTEGGGVQPCAEAAFRFACRRESGQSWDKGTVTAWLLLWMLPLCPVSEHLWPGLHWKCRSSPQDLLGLWAWSLAPCWHSSCPPSHLRPFFKACSSPTH